MHWYWVILITALPSWFLWVVLHEASHLLMAWWHGWPPIGFYPYPHWYDRGTGTVKHPFQRRPDDIHKFRFAGYATARNTPIGKGDAVAIAPMYAGVAVTLSLGWPPLLGCWWTLALALWGLAGVGFFWWQCWWGSAETDGKRWRCGGSPF